MADNRHSRLRATTHAQQRCIRAASADFARLVPFTADSPTRSSFKDIRHSSGVWLFTSRSLPVPELLESVLGELRERRRLVEVPRFPKGGLGVVPLSGLGQGEPEPVVSGDHDRLELDSRAEGLDRLLRLAHPDVRL